MCAYAYVPVSFKWKGAAAKNNTRRWSSRSSASRSTYPSVHWAGPCRLTIPRKRKFAREVKCLRRETVIGSPSRLGGGATRFPTAWATGAGPGRGGGAPCSSSVPWSSRPRHRCLRRRCLRQVPFHVKSNKIHQCYVLGAAAPVFGRYVLHIQFDGVPQKYQYIHSRQRRRRRP